MASTNWTNPTLAGTHVDILSELKGRDVDALKFIDDETPTNLPEKAKKWDDGLKVFRSWVAAAWTTLVLAVAGGGTGSATAAGARTNLSVDSSAEVDGKVATHQAITNPHSSTHLATPSRLVLRDAAGRAAVVAPSAEGDIALKSNVTTVQGNLDTHAALANPHGAVSAPTVNKLMLRDAAGRSQVEDPSADKDVVNKQFMAANAAPVGMITAYGGAAAPTGWLLCQGAAISRTTYAALFAAIGTAFGVGDGSTTFNLPDLQQRFPLGKAPAGTGSTLGGTGGAIDHTHTGPSHTHDLQPSGVTISTSATVQAITCLQDNTLQNFNVDPEGGSKSPVSKTTVAAGTGASGTNNPPYQVVNYIIKT